MGQDLAVSRSLSVPVATTSVHRTAAAGSNTGESGLANQLVATRVKAVSPTARTAGFQVRQREYLCVCANKMGVQASQGQRGPMEVNVPTPSRDALQGRAHGPQRIKAAARTSAASDTHTW